MSVFYFLSVFLIFPTKATYIDSVSILAWPEPYLLACVRPYFKLASTPAITISLKGNLNNWRSSDYVWRFIIRIRRTKVKTARHSIRTNGSGKNHIHLNIWRNGNRLSGGRRSINIPIGSSASDQNRRGVQ